MPIEKVIERIQIKEIPVVETEERVVEVCVPPHVYHGPHPREGKHVVASVCAGGVACGVTGGVACGVTVVSNSSFPVLLYAIQTHV